MTSTKFIIGTIWRVSLVLLIITIILIPFSLYSFVLAYINYFKFEGLLQFISNVFASLTLLLKILLTYVWYLCIAKLLLIITKNQRNLNKIFKNFCK